MKNIINSRPIYSNHFLVKQVLKAKGRTIIFILLLVIELNNIISTKKYNIFYSQYSSITIKIKGTGIANVYSDHEEIGMYSHDFIRPKEIYINEINQTSLNSKYNLNKTENIIKLIWNDYINVATSYMFKDCGKISEIDLSHFDSSLVLYMEYMFDNCKSLTSINFFNYNTSKVRDMSYMFRGCISLTSLNISNFDTKLVENMGFMFQNCFSLISLNLSNFNTSLVDKISYIFSNCSSLKKLDISSFKLPKITSSNHMFVNCSSLSSIDLSKFENSKISYVNQMLSNCYSLKFIDLSNFRLEKDSSADKMLMGTTNVRAINFANVYFNDNNYRNSIISGLYSLNSNIIICGKKEIFSNDGSSYEVNLNCMNKLFNISNSSNEYICYTKFFNESDNSSCPDFNFENDEINDDLNTIDSTNINFINESFYTEAIKSYSMTYETNTIITFNVETIYNYIINNDTINTDVINNYSIYSDTITYDNIYTDTINNTTNNNILISHTYNNDVITTFYADTPNDSDINTSTISIYSEAFNKETYNSINTFSTNHIYNDTIDTFITKTINYEIIKYKSIIQNSINSDTFNKETFNNEKESNINNIINSDTIKNKASMNNTFNTDSIYNDFSHKLSEQCYISCKTCEKNGNESYHNCLECGDNYIYEFDISNNKNCYDGCPEGTLSNLYYQCVEIITNITENKTQFVENIRKELIKGFNRNNIDKGIDLEIKEYDFVITITSTKNQINNKNMEKTSIDLGECEIKLKNTYKIPNDKPLYILKIDKIKEGMKIPKIEYEVYYPLYNNDTLVLLDLSICENIKIDIYIPVEINDTLEKYDKDSNYYTDLCSKATTNSGTDITLTDRKNEFVENNMTLCEEDCDLKDYDYDNETVKCSCEIKIKLPLIDEIKFDKKKLYDSFTDIKNIANLNLMKCYKEILIKDSI